jgi:DNA-binding MarR family transcriptional regulator
MPVTTASRECTDTKLRQLLRSIGRDYEAELAPEGIQVTQYSLLARLMALGPQRPTDFAKLTRMQLSTLSRNLRPLQSAGWLKVQPGEDGRSRLISVTPQGRAKMLQVRERWASAQEKLASKAGSSRLAALHRLIDEILESLELHRN